MKDLVIRVQFKRDLKRMLKRGVKRPSIERILDVLRRGQIIPPVHQDHPLKGEWIGWRECHVTPDWLLVYRVTDGEVILARTGTHDDLFKL